MTFSDRNTINRDLWNQPFNDNDSNLKDTNNFERFSCSFPQLVIVNVLGLALAKRIAQRITLVVSLAVHSQSTFAISTEI